MAAGGKAMAGVTKRPEHVAGRTRLRVRLRPSTAHLVPGARPLQVRYQPDRDFATSAWAAS